MKRNILFIVASYVLILFTYPFFRVTTTTLFFQSYGASHTPMAQVMGIILIGIVILGINHFQKRVGIHRLYCIFVPFVSMLFLTLYFLYINGFTWAAFALFSLKEAYIVIVVHLVLGYCNHYFNRDEVKMFYGPLGGVSSLAAMLGGLLTSVLAKYYQPTMTMFIGAFLLCLSAILFWFTQRLRYQEEERLNVSPLVAVSKIKEYAFLIAIIIALSQFAITVAELKFNLLFEQLVSNSDGRAEKLALIYSSINAFSLCVQFFILPFIAIKFSNKVLHYFIPAFYLFAFFIGNGMAGEFLISVSLTYILYKGIDYSLFALCKEVLYQCLTTMQKYGAKYIADMFSYRTAKGVISLVLIQYQSPELLNVLIYSFLALWVIALYFLFYFERKYFQSA